MKALLKNYSRLWLLAFLGTVLMAVLMTVIENLKVTNILKIEFSGSMDAFQHLVQGQEDKLQANTLLDFLFVVVYTLLFLVSLKVSALSLQTDLKKRYYVICLLPGFFDIIENVSLLDLLDHRRASSFEWFYTAVRVKWALVIPFILMVLSILLYYALIIFGKTINLFLGKKRHSLHSDSP